MDSLPLFLVTLVFSSLCDFSQEMSTVTAMAKDQVSCTMCSSCDNPCQPIFSPPPPPSPQPPSSGINCPPPPSPPNNGVYYYSPPPPANPSYYPPPSGSGGNPSYYPPRSGSGGNPSYYPPTNAYGYTTPPPPNPILPYFPFFYYNTPPASPHSDSKSVQLKTQPSVASLIILSLLLLL
ncbi:Uncharacterized protein Adt_16105 [Abeliophyllum distichum]|uniref:Uncharacterized protein n=1 Tax=Abeliophyllum distichum TaxID=126358 RepID=A0ABD1TCR3_9LAMI